jgi:preprotein translocase subunit SecG
MTQPVVKPRGALAAHPVRAAVIAILLAALIACTLLVSIYDRATPKIGDFPFFYFYLLVYFPVMAIVLWIVVLLQRGLTTADDDSGTAGTAGAAGSAVAEEAP